MIYMNMETTQIKEILKAKHNKGLNWKLEYMIDDRIKEMNIKTFKKYYGLNIPTEENPLEIPADKENKTFNKKEMITMDKIIGNYRKLRFRHSAMVFKCIYNDLLVKETLNLLWKEYFILKDRAQQEKSKGHPEKSIGYQTQMGYTLKNINFLKGRK